MRYGPPGMPSLRELQVSLLDALGSSPPVAPRLEVYRSNVRNNFADALGSSFPAIRRLVGEDYFRQTAREFQRRHPSRSGDLLHAGEPFPRYLAELHHGDGFDYLGEVARLEWLIQETLLSADHAPLDLAQLARIAPAEYDALRFELHPALRLFESKYPALRIWEANVGSEAEPEHIDLRGGGERLALACRRLQLQFHRVNAGEYCFLNSLSRGECFAAAVACGEDGDPCFDASAALQRFVAAEAIVGFDIRHPDIQHLEDGRSP
ncbi:MAG: DNA-binding domain-containing protein [Pseudomonadota bacterium]|nr:DNA-binding domain-containing protein [Pseudomonadota bacterium]